MATEVAKCLPGYPFFEGQSEFRFEMNLSYKLKRIIEVQ
jgi:hypothetical protein